MKPVKRRLRRQAHVVANGRAVELLAGNGKVSNDETAAIVPTAEWHQQIKSGAVGHRCFRFGRFILFTAAPGWAPSSAGRPLFGPVLYWQLQALPESPDLDVQQRMSLLPGVLPSEEAGRGGRSFRAGAGPVVVAGLLGAMEQFDQQVEIDADKENYRHAVNFPHGTPHLLEEIWGRWEKPTGII
jgi:hypothetical protein